MMFTIFKCQKDKILYLREGLQYFYIPVYERGWERGWYMNLDGQDVVMLNLRRSDYFAADEILGHCSWFLMICYALA